MEQCVKQCLVQSLSKAEAEVYAALTLIQQEANDVNLENILDKIHDDILKVLDRL